MKPTDRMGKTLCARRSKKESNPLQGRDACMALGCTDLKVKSCYLSPGRVHAAVPTVAVPTIAIPTT